MIQFKNPDLEADFYDFNRIDPRLHGLMCALSTFVENEIEKDIIVTDIARPGEKGPHGLREDNPVSRAVDVRCHFGYFTAAEILLIKEWLKKWFPRSDQEALEKSIPDWYGTLRHHGAGPNEHLHIAVETLKQLRAILL